MGDLFEALETESYEEKYRLFARNTRRFASKDLPEIQRLIEQCVGKDHPMAQKLVLAGCEVACCEASGLEFIIAVALKSGLAQQIREQCFYRLTVAQQLEFMARVRSLPDFEHLPPPPHHELGVPERYDIDIIFHLLCRLRAGETAAALKKFNSWLQRADRTWVPKTVFSL